MGALFSTLYALLWRTHKNYKLVEVGLDNAGKTTSLYKLQLGAPRVSSSEKRRVPALTLRLLPRCAAAQARLCAPRPPWEPTWSSWCSKTSTLRHGARCATSSRPHAHARFPFASTLPLTVCASPASCDARVTHASNCAPHPRSRTPRSAGTWAGSRRFVLVGSPTFLAQTLSSSWSTPRTACAQPSSRCARVAARESAEGGWRRAWRGVTCAHNSLSPRTALTRADARACVARAPRSWSCSACWSATTWSTPPS
jgi:hypothetical protein